jgi:hypothetical protein
MSLLLPLPKQHVPQLDQPPPFIQTAQNKVPVLLSQATDPTELLLYVYQCEPRKNNLNIEDNNSLLHFIWV